VKGARRKGDYSTEPRHRGTSSGPDVCAQACDVLVVGGGVNGAGIARDATGRGLTAVLCEQHDLASHPSSRSTKPIHGDHLGKRALLPDSEFANIASTALGRPLRSKLKAFLCSVGVRRPAPTA